MKPKIDYFELFGPRSNEALGVGYVNIGVIRVRLGLSIDGELHMGEQLLDNQIAYDLAVEMRAKALAALTELFGKRDASGLRFLNEELAVKKLTAAQPS